jgi:hypothetical protein
VVDPVKLAVLSVAGCPHVPLLEQRLTAALGDRTDVEITRQVISDAREAASAGLHGSPTLLVNGADPFAVPGQRASMSCRLYDNGPGLVEGAPSVARLRQVIGAPAAGDPA